jgi:phage FluMu protein gp41
MLAEIEQILAEREQRTARLANDLADYLESRRRAYSILNRRPSPDDLHGPLDARTLLAASNRVLARLQGLSVELERAQAPLLALRDRIATLRREIQELEASDPGGSRLALRRQSVATLEGEWETETERVRRSLAAHDQLHAEGVRILTAMGRSDTTIRQWDTLGGMVRTRIARLALSPPP